jgi:hypothetical protein
MYFGHVEQVASNEDRHTVLVRCPRCAWLYEMAPAAPCNAHALSELEARERYAF